ncbi:MucBP domain-containing protein [Enterococcus faecalis]|uniref:LPXTG-domain-containing protein cell wall anchor domain n=1 Tax=Enterococcus faecalis ATCC 6055 TaxID=1169311 RepID=R3K5T6_ENTFL|nr:MucBP domain-containing protein [Enterococcus faecalis]EOK08846.1 LPXTG-domain-containing protein cell wall anchor domain [Enterococcus faecalis ATCC 6055]
MKKKIYTHLSLLVMISSSIATPLPVLAEVSNIDSSMQEEQKDNDRTERTNGEETGTSSNLENATEVSENNSINESSTLETTQQTASRERFSAKNLDSTGISLSPTNLNKEMSARNIITFTYSIKTTLENGIKKGDKIVLEVPSAGFNYESISVVGLPTYFAQSIDQVNNQIVFTATQDISYESESATSFSVVGNPTKTAENTDVLKPISYPVSSTYIPSDGEIVNLLPTDTVLLVRNVSSNFSGVTAAVYPGLENSKVFDSSRYTNNFKGLLDADTGYYIFNQNAQLFTMGSFNTSNNRVKKSSGHIRSNFEIDKDSLKQSFLNGEVIDSINTVMDADNKGFTYTINNMPLFPTNGWSQYISFFVITNSSSDIVTVKNDYTITNDLDEIKQGTDEKTGLYGVNPDGKFIPRITGEDTTVYTSDPKLDLISLVKATDIKDGDITKNIKIENNGGFDQSKPGSYNVTYSVMNSDKVVATKTIIISVLYKDAKPVTINYVDEEGNTLAESDTLNGKVGLPYETKAKSINGWTVKTTPDNATGTFSEEAQTVTYVYERTDAKSVTVNYVDGEGNALAERDTLNGKVGLPYETKAKSINGWTVKTTPDNATGTFSEEAQTVTYVYERTDAKPDTVNYVDEEGNTHTPTTQSKLIRTARSETPTTSKNYLPKTGEQKIGWLTIIGVLLIGSTGGYLYFRKKVKS